MYQSNQSFNIPPPSPTGNPQAFELLKTGLFKFPSLGAKKPFITNVPPISTEIPLLKGKFRL